MSKTITILGAGFGGLRVALDLGVRRRELGDVKIVLVDRNAYHTYTPLLYEVATGFFHTPRSTDEASLQAGIRVDLRELCCKGNGVEFVQKEILQIDFTADTTVLALGSETDDYGIPGVLEHGMAYKTVNDALALRRKLLNFIDRKRRGEEVQVAVVVGGGGATGVELAAELAQFMKHFGAHGIKSGDYAITLAEASPRLLAGADPKLGTWAYDRLAKLGVTVLRDTCVKRAEALKVVMAPRPLKPGENPDALLCDFRAENERTFESDVFVWCGGVRGPRALAGSGLALDPKGRVVVDEYGRAKDRPGVWAIGDCAAWGAPALAQAAIDEARLVADNIIREHQQRALRRYQIREYPLALPMGGKYAVMQVGKSQARGFWPWVIRQLADLRYFISVTSFGKAFDLFIAGARVYQKND